MGLKVEVLIYPIQKVIFHLEAFVAKFMRIYERSVHSKSSITHASTNISIAGLWAWTSSNLQVEPWRMMIAHYVLEAQLAVRLALWRMAALRDLTPSGACGTCINSILFITKTLRAQGGILKRILAFVLVIRDVHWLSKEFNFRSAMLDMCRNIQHEVWSELLFILGKKLLMVNIFWWHWGMETRSTRPKLVGCWSYVIRYREVTDPLPGLPLTYLQIDLSSFYFVIEDPFTNNDV